jgi:hypothetical protein
MGLPQGPAGLLPFTVQTMNSLDRRRAQRRSRRQQSPILYIEHWIGFLVGLGAAWAVSGPTLTAAYFQIQHDIARSVLVADQ